MFIIRKLESEVLLSYEAEEEYQLDEQGSTQNQVLLIELKDKQY